MARYLLVTAVGQDKPGLVAGVTEALLEAGCNLEDSSMTRLRGDFAMMLFARCPDDSIEALTEQLRQVGQTLGLSLHMREVTEAETHRPTDDGDTFHISVYGADRAGIVHAISERLAERGADITDLRTTIAGQSGHPIYIMQIEALAAAGDDPAALAAAVTDAGVALGVDVAVQRLDPVAL